MASQLCKKARNLSREFHISRMKSEYGGDRMAKSDLLLASPHRCVQAFMAFMLFLAVMRLAFMLLAFMLLAFMAFMLFLAFMFLETAIGNNASLEEQLR